MFTKARELEESVVREGGADMAVTEVLKELEEEMAEAATKLEFERAALLRDQIRELKKQAGLAADDGGPQVAGPRKSVKYPKPGRRRGGAKKSG